MLPRTGAAWNVEDANVRTPDRVVVHVIAGDLPAICRDALETLTALIERRAEESRAARRATRSGRVKGAAEISGGPGGRAGKTT